MPSTRKDWTAHARYFPGLRPIIHIYSYRDTLPFKLPPHMSLGRAELGWTLEREFRMRLEAVGARLFIRWEPDDLRRFILEYVLVHEVGHHVHYKERLSQKQNPLPSVEVQEQFAEDYAIRYIRAQRGIGYSNR